MDPFHKYGPEYTSISHRFAEWLARLESFSVARNVRVDLWSAVAVAYLVLICGMSVLEPNGRVFGPHSVHAVIAASIAVVVVVATSILARRWVLRGRTKAVAILGARVLLQWFPGCLIALSHGAVVVVFTSLFVCTASIDGYLFRTGTKYPFGVPTTLLAIAGSAWINPTVDHLSTFAVCGLTAIAGNLLVGTFALRVDALRAHSEQLRSAVEAQILCERVADVQRLSPAFVNLLALDRSIDDALVHARTKADLLIRSQANGTTRRDSADVSQIASDIGETLERVKRILEEARRIGRSTLNPDEVIDVVEIGHEVRRVLSNVGVRFPRIKLHGSLSEIGTARVLIRGGHVLLNRILVNVLTNACEGDGLHTASNVTVTAKREPAGHVTLTVIDDGPGFSPELLARLLQGFQTTKRDGTGLGLYAAEHIIAASGGALTLAASPAGGASVALTFASG